MKAEPLQGPPPESRIARFLRELLTEGGRSGASDPVPAWLSPYLGDYAPADTMNAAIASGHVRCSHDGILETSQIALTESGRAAAEAAGGKVHAAAELEPNPLSDAYASGFGHGNAHDRPYDPLWSYGEQEKADYAAGFAAGRDRWIAGKPARAWIEGRRGKR